MAVTRKHVKVAVTGAAGQIGYALLFRMSFSRCKNIWHYVDCSYRGRQDT